MRQEREALAVESRGWPWCTRTRRWKVRYANAAAAWDMADRILAQKGDVVFVYQCAGFTTLRARPDKVTRQRYDGCGGYHLTKRPRMMIGALGIAYHLPGDSQMQVAARFGSRRRILEKLVIPPAPPLNRW